MSLKSDWTKARAGCRNLVLRGDQGLVGGELLLDELSVTAARLGLRPRASDPHLTLVYGANAALPASRVDPIRWRVTEFVLIHSLIGHGRHERLGTWRL